MKLLNWLKPLIAVDNTISLGRVTLWVTLGVSLYHYRCLSGEWAAVLTALLMYNLTGKFAPKQ